MSRTKLLLRSAKLDAWTIRSPLLSRREKIAFLGNKYALLARHAVRPFNFGHDWTDFDGRQFYYESPYGLASLQGTLTSHMGALREGGAADIRTVVDVGANVGTFAIAARRAYPAAQVHCCEPVPEVADVLERNVRGDQHVKVHRVALSSKSGTAHMTYDPGHSLISQLDDAGPLRVAVTTLDELADSQKIDVIDLLKIDTETFEAEVLDGAVVSLSATRYLFIEITVEGNPRYTVSSLLGRLSSDTYDFQLIAARNWSGRSEGPVPIMDALFVNTRPVINRSAVR